MQQERDDEALRLLQEASCRIESYAVTSQLANLQMETGRYTEARDNFEDCVRLAPLLDKSTKPWLAALRCEAAYRCGNLEKASEWAREAKGHFYEVQADRLKNPPAQRKRVCLPVGFVRQHHWTCAPATLAAICRYWSMPGDHLEVAAAITYAGTPNHSERQWAIENGWFTTEFTVTWESAQKVIDAGIPFTLTTPEVRSSHLQAVIGYDDARHTLIIRDPGERHQVRHAWRGARPLSLFRSARPGLGADEGKTPAGTCALPDAELYDQIFRMERALEGHDRARAEEICRALAANAGEHRIVFVAERILAAYDADSVRSLSAVEKLLKLFPDDLPLHLSKVSMLRDLARRSDIMEFLEKLCKQPKTDSAFWQQYAKELAGDARTWPEAERWLSARFASIPPPCAASASWRKSPGPSANSKMPSPSPAWRPAWRRPTSIWRVPISNTPNFLGRSEEGLDFLQRRFERFGKKSGQPAQSLAWANFHLERTAVGYAILEQAMALRPDDAELQLAVVDQYLQHGKFAEARRLAVSARRRSQCSAWLRSVAYLEAAQGNLGKARGLWARVLALQPLAEDAHRSYSRLLAETVGRQATSEHLQAVCERFPHHFRLTQLLMEWQREDGPQAVEPVVRRLIDLHPSDAWSWRQLALTLAEQNRLEEAFVALAAAEPLEPASLGYHGVRGALLKQAGLFAQAKESYRAALCISVDATFAMTELVRSL